MNPDSQSGKHPDADSETPREHGRAADVSPEVKERNKPSGTHYVEPSPLGIEPVVQTGVDQQTNPPRSTEHPAQTAEVPFGTGEHAEPPGGGGLPSHKK